MELPQRIVTDRLVLRPLAAADERDFVAYLTDPGGTEFMFTDTQKTEPGARAFFREIIVSYDTDKPYFLLCLTRADAGEFIGTCGLSGLPETRALEVFCCIAPAHRRRRFATEALRALMTHCVAEYKVSEFVAHINLHNPVSPALAKRLGMRLTGRANHPVSGDESNMYSLTVESMNSG